MTGPTTTVPALDLLQFIVTMPLGPLGVERHTPRAGHKWPRGAVRDGRRPGLGHFLWPKATQTGPAGNISRSGSQRHHRTALSPTCVHTDMSPQLEGPQQRIIAPPSLLASSGGQTTFYSVRPFPDHMQAVRSVQGSSAHEPPHPALTRPRRGSLCGEEAERSVDPGGLRGKRAGIRRDALFSSPLWWGWGAAALGRGLHLHPSPLPAGAIIPTPRNPRGPRHKDNNPFLTPAAAVRRGGCESMVSTAGTASEGRYPQLSPRG